MNVAAGAAIIAYLRDVLNHLPSSTNKMIPEFTPAKWADARNGKLPQAA
jgi:hypothetical protein